MDSQQQLPAFIQHLANDPRLRPVHIALGVALCCSWIEKEFSTEYFVSRRELMRKAHISSTATYHKVISELQAFGYLHYKPSYHPRKGSLVSLLLPAEQVKSIACMQKVQLRVVPKATKISLPTLYQPVNEYEAVP